MRKKQLYCFYLNLLTCFFLAYYNFCLTLVFARRLVLDGLKYLLRRVLFTGTGFLRPVPVNPNDVARPSHGREHEVREGVEQVSRHEKRHRVEPHSRLVCRERFHEPRGPRPRVEERRPDVKKPVDKVCLVETARETPREPPVELPSPPESP